MISPRFGNNASKCTRNIILIHISVSLKKVEKMDDDSFELLLRNEM